MVDKGNGVWPAVLLKSQQIEENKLAQPKTSHQPLWGVLF